MHKATNIFVETLYSVFACAYKQEELIIGLPPAALRYCWWFEFFELFLPLICSGPNLCLVIWAFWAFEPTQHTIILLERPEAQSSKWRRQTEQTCKRILVRQLAKASGLSHWRSKKKLRKSAMKAQTSSWPPPVRTLQSQVFMSRRLGENFWPGIAAALLVRVTEVGCNWCEDSPFANCVESSCSMAHGGGNRRGFSKPFLASVFASRPSCLYLNWRQKAYPKLKPFLASDFSLLGCFLGTLYDAQGDQYFCWDVIFSFCLRIQARRTDNWTSPSQLNHRQASICMLLRCSKNTGGVLELVRNFTDVLRSWLWRRNPVQWLWSWMHRLPAFIVLGVCFERP